jgi:hypothetical protein
VIRRSANGAVISRASIRDTHQMRFDRRFYRARRF